MNKEPRAEKNIEHPGDRIVMAAHVRSRRPVLDKTEKRTKLPILAIVTLASILIPAYVDIGSFTVTPSRILFALIVPFLAIRLMSGSYNGVSWIDYAIFLFCAWMAIAIFVVEQPRRAIEFSGSNTLTILGGYLVARSTIKGQEEFIALIRFLAYVVTFSLPFVIYESATGDSIILRWLDGLPGITSHGDVNHPPRLGLWRSQFVFVHPIHYGLFCLISFTLVFVGLKENWSNSRRYFFSAIIAICCFLSVSSGAVLALAFAIGLIIWHAVTSWTGRPWILLTFIIIICYLFIEVATERLGIYSIVERFTFSKRTLYARRIIFDAGISQVLKTPIFGIGLGTYPIPRWFTGSMDNYWLFLALRYGIPSLAIMLVTYFGAIICVGRANPFASGQYIHLRRAWVFSMISLALSLITVAIWDELYSLVMFVFGCGLWMISKQPKADLTVKVDQEETDFQRPYSRFPIQVEARR